MVLTTGAGEALNSLSQWEKAIQICRFLNL